MGKMTSEMQLVPIGKLVPYVNNARTHSKEQITKLRSSLREARHSGGDGHLQCSIKQSKC